MWRPADPAIGCRWRAVRRHAPAPARRCRSVPARTRLLVDGRCPRAGAVRAAGRRRRRRRCKGGHETRSDGSNWVCSGVMDDPIVWMSTKEAADRLGVTLRTVYRFIDEGQLPGYKVGRVIRLKQHEVDE